MRRDIAVYRYLYTLHFASYVENASAHQEFKGTSRIPIECKTSPLTCEDGTLQVPSRPGFDVRIDPDWMRRAERVETS